MKNLVKRKINEQIAEFLYSVSRKDNLAIIYDDDVDGLVSAALTKFALERMNIPFSQIVIVKKPFQKFLLKFKKNKKIIILDTPSAYDVKYPKTHQIFIIDHHPPKKLTKNVLILNPRFEKKRIYQPVAYLTYKLFSQFIKLKDKEWLSVVGTITDFGFKDCMDLLWPYIKTKDSSKMWKNKYGKAGMMLDSAIGIIGFENTMKTILESKSVEDLINNKKIRMAHQKFERQLKLGKKEFWKNAEQHGKVIFSILPEKYEMLSKVLVFLVSSKNPDKIIFMILKKKKMYRVHARYQDAKVNLGILLKKCCDIRGGGHEPAAGGSFTSFEIFKTKILRELDNFTR